MGGRWVGNSFAYNRSVNNVNVTVIHNTYNETVVNNVTVNKVSYNGGPGGTSAAPTAQERAAASEQHIPPTAMQHQHVQEAARNPALTARANGGHPAIAATPRPAAFNAPGVVGARGAATPPGGVAHTPTPGQPNGARTQGQPGQANGGGSRPRTTWATEWRSSARTTRATERRRAHRDNRGSPMARLARKAQPGQAECRKNRRSRPSGSLRKRRASTRNSQPARSDSGRVGTRPLSF